MSLGDLPCFFRNENHHGGRPAGSARRIGPADRLGGSARRIGSADRPGGLRR
jgi:hypothetical protein